VEKIADDFFSKIPGVEDITKTKYYQIYEENIKFAKKWLGDH